jgi:hypothetical protein
MGERIFGLWCDSVGLTANGSEVDETGWDFFVEFPCKPHNGLPRDMSPAPIECKIQVKSTDHRRKGVRVTLSNLERLIKAKMPAFFCFIEFDCKNEAQAAYLVHVGKEIIGKTLKKIRELDSQGERHRLHKHKMIIKYGDSDRLADTTGESLKRAIERHIPSTLEKYIEDKNKLLETLGFEDGKGELTITVSGNDPVSDIIDLSLGLREEIYIDKSVAYHKRFGILSENQLLSSEKAILDIKFEPKRAVLTFRKYKFSPGVSLDAEVYVSPFNKILPEQYLKFRVKSKMFDFVFEPFNGKEKCSFNFREDRRSCLDELKNHLRVFTMLKNASRPLILEISDEGKELPKIPFNISVNDEIHDWSDVYKIAEMASSICRKFSISESEVLVTIDELIQSSRSIEVFYHILYADPETFCDQLPADAQGYQQGDRLACTSSVMAVIGSHLIRCFWAIVGSLSLVKRNQYKLVVDEIRAGNELVAIDGEVIEQNEINEKFDEFEQELQSMGLATIRML